MISLKSFTDPVKLLKLVSVKSIKGLNLIFPCYVPIDVMFYCFGPFRQRLIEDCPRKIAIRLPNTIEKVSSHLHWKINKCSWTLGEVTWACKVYYGAHNFCFQNWLNGDLMVTLKIFKMPVRFPVRALKQTIFAAYGVP